jgi:hypothetical protein
MYSVKETSLVLSMVGKAKAPEHKIKTSLLEYDEPKIVVKMMMINTRQFT